MKTQEVTVESALESISKQVSALGDLAKAKSKYLDMIDDLFRQKKEIEGKIAECDRMAHNLVKVTDVHPDKVVEVGPISKIGDESLASLLKHIMVGRACFSIREAACAARVAGFKSDSTLFEDVVGDCLRKYPCFTRVRRGMYRVLDSTSPKSQNLSVPDQSIYFAKKSYKNGKNMATFIYQHAPKGNFTIHDVTKLVKNHGAKTTEKNLAKSISARLGQDNRFRHVKRGTWVRVFPGNRV